MLVVEVDKETELGDDEGKTAVTDVEGDDAGENTNDAGDVGEDANDLEPGGVDEGDGIVD